jgi:hypothetical protein
MTSPVLVLDFASTVSAVFEWSTVPSGGAMSCPNYPHTLITAPNTFVTLNLPMPLAGCDLTVHPVVIGGAGGGPDG